jgi:hypothetical protein
MISADLFVESNVARNALAGVDEEIPCGEQVTAGIALRVAEVSVSYIVKDAIKRPKHVIKRSVASSDADTTASERVSESERESFERPAIFVEELSSEDVCERVELGEEEPVSSEDACEKVQPDDTVEVPAVVDSRKREDLLRSVVVQLQSQRTDVEKENIRLQQELMAKESLLSAAVAETQKPQLCLKQAKQLEQQRSKRTQKQLKQDRLQEQQRQSEIEAARCEVERRASEITAHALAQADAIRAAAREKNAELNLTVIQRKTEHSELQKSIEQQQSVLVALTDQQQEVQNELHDKRAEAANQLLHIQSEFQEILARKDDAQVAASQAALQLQNVLVAVELQTEKLQVLAAQEATAHAEQAASVAQDDCKQPLGNVNSVNLKRAKELERQRAQKQHKQAAHQRSLKRQQEAELCRMREEIEKEKASMLAAAEAELAAIRASIKSQGRALRQRNRRATAVRDVEPAADSLANHNECKEQQQEELAQIEEMPAAAANDSCCDSPDHQDAVSSVESAEVMADSSNEDDEVLEAEAQSEVQEEAVEEDWQVLSDGAEDDEALWDLVG